MAGRESLEPLPFGHMGRLGRGDLVLEMLDESVWGFVRTLPVSWEEPPLGYSVWTV